MDVYIIDTVTGTESVVAVDEDATLGVLKSKVASEHAVHPEDVLLDGDECGLDFSGCDDDDTLCSMGIEADSRIRLSRSTRRFLAMVRGGSCFKGMPDWVRDDDEVAFAAVSLNPSSFQHASRRLRGTESLLEAAKFHVSAVKYASAELRSCPDIALSITSSSGIRQLTEDVRGNPAVMLRILAIMNDANVHLAPALLADKEFLLQAVRFAPDALRFAPRELLADRDFALALLRRSRAAFKHLSEDLRDDAEIFRAAAGPALTISHAGPRVLSDPALLLLHLQRGGTLPQRYQEVVAGASRAMRCSAVAASSEVYRHLPLDLKRGDRELALIAAQSHGELQAIPDSLQADSEIQAAAVETDPYSLKYAPGVMGDRAAVLRAMSRAKLLRTQPLLQDDREAVLASVSYDAHSWRHASPRLQGDEEVALAAITGCCEVDHIRHILTTFQGEGFERRAATANPLCLAASATPPTKDAVLQALAALQSPGFAEPLRRAAAPQLLRAAPSFRSDAEVVLAAVEVHGIALKSAAQEMKSDLCIVLAAMQTYPIAHTFAESDCFASRDWTLRVCAANGGALQHASLALRRDRVVVGTALANSAVPMLYASHRFWQDEGMWAAALRSGIGAVNFACVSGGVLHQSSPGRHALLQRLFADPGVVGGLIRVGAHFALHRSPLRLRDDTELVLRAVRANGAALRFASARLRGNPTVVLAALQAPGGVGVIKKKSQQPQQQQQRGYPEALGLASDLLRGDPTFLREAIPVAPGCLRHAAEPLCSDPELLALQAEHGGGGEQEDAAACGGVPGDPFGGSPVLDDDTGRVMRAVRASGAALLRASARLRSSHAVALAAVAAHPEALRHVAGLLRCDRGFLRAAIAAAPASLQHAPEELRSDPELLGCQAEAEAEGEKSAEEEGRNNLAQEEPPHTSE